MINGEVQVSLAEAGLDGAELEQGESLRNFVLRLTRAHIACQNSTKVQREQPTMRAFLHGPGDKMLEFYLRDKKGLDCYRLLTELLAEK